MALPVTEGVFWGAGVQALVLVEDQRLLAAQAVCGVTLARQAALHAALTHLAQGEATEDTHTQNTF